MKLYQNVKISVFSSIVTPAVQMITIKQNVLIIITVIIIFI